MIVAVGLGNPGKKYESTRHNIGFQVIDRLAAQLHVTSWENKFDAKVARGNLDGQPFLLVKPQTFVNRSGWAVQGLLHFFKVPLEQVIVIVDDLDLEVGKVRLRGKGSDGGHRGLRSIIECMGSQGFKRVRVGVGRPHPGESAVRRVLNRIRNKEEAEKLSAATDRAVQAAAEFISGGKFENRSSS